MSGYNGWQNYETWSVVLIADNDEYLYNERRELVADMVADGKGRYHIADAIKEWVMSWPEIESVDDSDGNHLVKQLLHAALDEVEWSEIAENWMSE